MLVTIKLRLLEQNEDNTLHENGVIEREINEPSEFFSGSETFRRMQIQNWIDTRGREQHNGRKLALLGYSILCIVTDKDDYDEQCSDFTALVVPVDRQAGHYRTIQLRARHADDARYKAEKIYMALGRVIDSIHVINGFVTTYSFSDY